MSDGKEVKRWWLRQNYRRKTWYVSGSDTYPRRDTDIAVMPVEDHDQIVAEPRAEVERQKKKIEAFVDAEMVRAEYQGFTYGQALDEIAKQKTNIATQARVIEIAKRVLNNAGLRPPDGGTPTVETICEDLSDAMTEIAAIEKSAGI